MKHFLFDMLFFVAGLLLAIRLTQFWNSQDNDIGRLPVNLFLVYSSIHGIANDQQRMAHIPHFCSVSILRTSLRFKDHRSGKLIHLYIFALLISNSWDTEKILVQNPLLTTLTFRVDCVMSVLDWMTAGFVATHATSGIIQTAKA